jgi:hypothetical protein
MFKRAGRPWVPADTPEEIRDSIVWAARAPVPLGQSDADGSDVTLPPQTETPPHRLVVLGDSISHGFKSFAISETDRSWPALVARYAGFSDFRYPRYPGPKECPGLPLNLEAVLRWLEKDTPSSVLDVVSGGRLGFKLRSLMDEVEDYWERGEGAMDVREAPDGQVNHNLAIWGWDVRDVLSRNVRSLTARVNDTSTKDNSLGQIPAAAGERSALLTLAGGGPDDTPISLAKRLGDEGSPGIETLVVAVGGNNILGTVLDFQIRWTDGSGKHRDVDDKGVFNAWLPSHFAEEFDQLLAEVRTIKARHVILFTVPHVTIVPMVRAAGERMPGDRYFARYTRPWITDDVFSPNRHACLSGNQLRALDFAVDQYNRHIVARVREERGKGFDWRVLDVAGMLDRLAFRRYFLDDAAQPNWWTPYELPDPYLELSPQPDSRFYRSDKFGRHSGGLFALDGVHPTTIGYGLVAREVMGVMTEAGVDMARSEPDFDEVILLDSLISDPPKRISSVLNLMEDGNRSLNLYQALRGRPPV